MMKKKMVLDEITAELQEIRDKYNNGDRPVYVMSTSGDISSIWTTEISVDHDDEVVIAPFQ